MFIAGRKDWGIYQKPDALENMQLKICTNMQACELIEGAGHWVQQERPEEVAKLLLKFLSIL
jgi:pimeloyl-ACP methyl ester carboxylesterase